MTTLFLAPNTLAGWRLALPPGSMPGRPQATNRLDFFIPAAGPPAIQKLQVQADHAFNHALLCGAENPRDVLAARIAFVSDESKPAGDIEPARTPAQEQALGEAQQLEPLVWQEMRKEDFADCGAAIKELARLAPQLEKTDLLDFLRRAEAHLEVEDPVERRVAVLLVSAMMTPLEGKELLDWVLKFEALEAEDYVLRQMIIAVIVKHMPRLAEEHYLDRIQNLEARYEDEVHWVIIDAIGAVSTLAPSLKQKDRFGRIANVGELFEHSNRYVREAAIKLVGVITPQLAEEHQAFGIRMIKQGLEDNAGKVRRSTERVLSGLREQGIAVD